MIDKTVSKYDLMKHCFNGIAINTSRQNNKTDPNGQSTNRILTRTKDPT